MSNYVHVIRDFYTLKIGPKVLFDVRRCPVAKVTSTFDYPTSLLCRRPIEILRLSLTVQKLYDCMIGLKIWHSGSTVWGFGVSTPKHVTPKRHYFQVNRVIWAIVRANRLSRLVNRGLHEKRLGNVNFSIRRVFKIIVHPSVRSPLATDSSYILADQVTSLLPIMQNLILIGWEN
jgi:hypothetical protein